MKVYNAAGETIDVGGKNIVAFNSINYSYIEGGANPASYVPVVGGLIGSNESENTFIYLWFDKNDKLIQYVFTKGQNSSGTKVEF
ncbi:MULTISPECIES: hypothetical protein [unclassified Campylobacter]|nr:MULTISPECIES: hypothetical protein [unclassified Campylobacter]KAA6226876.1 hypothetical protein FMM55_04835 [Campylobacter sp. LR196d]KAA6233835.1 hypothetical protein FMM56_02690 [Campylobacter sp. LR264d]KAA6226385.1 hypothetical protein FMM57_06270 [Campylobacter sp. LR286c]KAA6226577.1 hypothetical protein FMM54_03965 [Campylobacter sp. LR185c]KAA6230314.1 hypothetical protein FMM58_06470 [Campylobacter sp. LR291e]